MRPIRTGAGDSALICTFLQPTMRLGNFAFDRSERMVTETVPMLVYVRLQLQRDIEPSLVQRQKGSESMSRLESIDASSVACQKAARPRLFDKATVFEFAWPEAL
jgi:hypothetical protein